MFYKAKYVNKSTLGAMVTRWSTEPKITGSRPVACVILLFFTKKILN